MSPFDAPVAYVLLAASLAVLLAAAVIANVRHPKTPAPTRPAAHEPRVGAGPTCDGCDLVAPVVKYHGHNYCQDCADEVAALHQMAVDKEIRAMDRRWGA